MKYSFKDKFIKYKTKEGNVGTIFIIKFSDDPKKKKYILKIDRITKETSKNETYNSYINRELDLYKYIDTMSQSDVKYFTKMYDYRIRDNCNTRHKKLSLKDKPKNSNIYTRTLKLKKENICYETILEYKGDTTLYKLFTQNKNKIKINIIYSFILQILY